MRRIQRYHVLCVLGDLKPHPFDQVMVIGSLHISNPLNRAEFWASQKIGRNKYGSDVFYSFLKKLMDDDLIMRVENERTKKIRLQSCNHKTHPDPYGPCFVYQVSIRDYDLQLTEKGRDCLAMEQIARDGDYSYYKNFQGTIESAKKINPGLFK